MDVFAVAGYGTYTPDSLNTGRAFMIEAGMGNCPEWLMFRHDVRRTGYLSPEEVEEACELSNTTNMSLSANSIKVYPNPNNGIFTVELDLLRETMVEVTLIDYLGRPLEKIMPASLLSGFQQLQLECPDDLPAGLYFLEVKQHGQHITYKSLALWEPSHH